MSFIGLLIILGIAALLSNNKKLINLKLVLTGLSLQFITGLVILKSKLGQSIVSELAKLVTSILDISKVGGKFVFGALADQELLTEKLSGEGSFIFAIQVSQTIILICALVSIFYYLGILQKIVKGFAWFFNKLLGVSGAEALANASVALVGQVESAIVISPYLAKLTKSEIMTIMTGGMACISGGLLAIYSSLGVETELLLAASFMAAPGSFVISKIMYPEDKEPETKDDIKIDYKPKENNLVEAILDGASSGLQISLGIIAMLLAFVSLVALIDKLLLFLSPSLSLKGILGYLFTPLIYLTGVPKEDVSAVAQLFGTKISLNEFIAYLDFITIRDSLTTKGAAITSIILCGFANFGSIAIQIGGLSQMAPERKSDFAEIGFKSMIAGALVSLTSGCIVGIVI